MGDDGFGPAVIRAFQAKYVVGPSIELVDLGTPGLDLSPWLADADRVIVVDTVNSASPPGTLRLYLKSDVLRYAPSVRVGPHDPGLKEALLALEFAGRAPRAFTLVGVVPARTEPDLCLSPAVQGAVAAAANCIAGLLRGGGDAVAERSTRADGIPAGPSFPAGL